MPSPIPPMAGGFTMIPIGVLRDTNLSIGARAIYALVRSYAWTDGFTDATLQRFSKDLGKGGSVRNVKRWMTELEEAGLIRRERRRRPKGETWETTRTWILVDVVNGQVVRREPGAAHGPWIPESQGPPVALGQEPGAAHGPWVTKSPGESQGPPVAHNIDAISFRDCIDRDIYVEPSGAPQDESDNADPEVRPLNDLAQAGPPPGDIPSTSGEPGPCSPINASQPCPPEEGECAGCGKLTHRRYGVIFACHPCRRDRSKKHDLERQASRAVDTLPHQEAL